MGISGGETGARRGPAIMPGGNKETYSEIQPIYEAIAAKASDGKPCCTYIGEDGAGHFVKMVHNGIEYADMQLIAEACLLLKVVGGYDNLAISKILHEWNQGELKSFLIGIAADIFAEEDPAGGYVVDYIVDASGQKGTGRWTSIESMKEGIDISMITAACNARVMSNLSGRPKAQKAIARPAITAQRGDEFVETVRKSLYAAKIIAYAQGFPYIAVLPTHMAGTSIMVPLLLFFGQAASSRLNSSIRLLKPIHEMGSWKTLSSMSSS